MDDADFKPASVRYDVLRDLVLRAFSLYLSACYFNVLLLCRRHINLRVNKMYPLLFSCFETVIHALVTSRLDYCTPLYTDPPASKHSSANYAASFLCHRSKFTHIIPLLCDFHSHFKILFTYKILYCLSPTYYSFSIIMLKQPRFFRSSAFSYYFPLTHSHLAWGIELS